MATRTRITVRVSIKRGEFLGDDGDLRAELDRLLKAKLAEHNVDPDAGRSWIDYALAADERGALLAEIEVED